MVTIPSSARNRGRTIYTFRNKRCMILCVCLAILNNFYLLWWGVKRSNEVVSKDFLHGITGGFVTLEGEKNVILS